MRESRGSSMAFPVHEIGLAEPDETRLLPDIERSACDLFLMIPATAGLPSCITPLEKFDVAQRDHLLWVARLGGAPIGFALVERLGPGLHLEELDVLPEHGLRGVGRALVREVCRQAQSDRVVLSLCTFKDVPWNAPFYAQLGFRVLRSDEIWPALSQRMDEEASRGLTSDLRVAMKFIGEVV